MKKALSFIAEHPVRISLSAGLVLLALHWGLLGLLPILAIFVIWEY